MVCVCARERERERGVDGVGKLNGKWSVGIMKGAAILRKKSLVQKQWWEKEKRKEKKNDKRKKNKVLERKGKTQYYQRSLKREKRKLTR